MKSRSSFEIIALTVLFVFAAACTKKKEFVNKVDEDGNGYLAKSSLAGKEYHLSAGVEDSQDDNQLYFATPGTNIDYGIVRAEITFDELRFVQAFNPQRRQENAEVMAAYKIIKHFDIEREKNDFKEETHKLVENTEKPWNQRAYMRVDWKNPVATNGKLGFQTMYGVKNLAVENANLVEPVTYKDGHLRFAVDATVIQSGAGDYGGSKNARIKMRTHLLEVKKNDFVPLQYSERDFSRFGFFYTQQLFTDPIKGLRDSGVKHFAEKFNICKPNTGRSCSTNVVKWNLTENFPHEYKALSKVAVEQYNKALKKILKREDDVVVLDESREVNLTDPTVNTIAYFGPDQGGLGIRQNMVNPISGEIVSARVVMYGGGINGLMGRVDDYIDMLIASGEGASLGLGDKDEEEKKGIAGKVSAGLKLGKLNTLQSLKSRREVLGLSTKGKAVAVDFNSQIKGSREHIAQVSGSLASKFNRMTSFAAAELSNLADLEKLKLAGIKGVQKPEDFVRGLMEKSGKLLDEKIDSNKTVEFANMQIEAQGFHNAEFVEDATLRFIEKALKEAGSLDKLSAQREAIKRKVAENVYYETILHELGHAFGLRHNFAASADEKNFTNVYKAKVEQMIKGDKSITPDDLHGSAYSSVMDYPADFFLIDAGLGPYDEAALEYAYGDLSEMAPADRNKLLDEKKDHPLVAANFKFCTDDNAGEDITCRRWDRGANASMITDHAIRSAKSVYLMNHFRRERVKFNLGEVIGRTFKDTLQIRQPMDEFLYQLIVAPNGSGCGNGLLGQAIARKEMFDICNKPADAAKLGVDLTDISTFHLALFNPDGTLIAGHPSNFLANGYADLLWSSMASVNYFQDLLGSPEPGFYVAVDEGMMNERTILVKLPESESLEQSLSEVAQERGEDPGAFTEKYGNRILEMKPGRVARYLESDVTGDQIHRKAERIGFFYDKYISMIVLGSRSIGIQKYAERSMSANSYLLPQTQKVVHGIFEKLIASKDKYLSQIPVILPAKNQAGQDIRIQKMAQVPAAINSDLEYISTLISLSTFSQQTDRSFSQSTKICLDNEPCLNAAGLEWTKFLGANGRQYKAAQTVDKNSIAVALLKNGVELNNKQKEMAGKISKRPELKAKALEKASKNKADRAKSDLEKRLTEFVGDSALADALTKSFDDMIKVVELTDGATRAQMLQGFYNVRNALEKARQAWVNKAIAKVQQAGENPQACQAVNEDGSPKVTCPVFAEVIKLHTELVAAQQKLYEAPSEAFALASLELEVDQIKRETNSFESKVQFMKLVHDSVNRFE